MILDIPQLLQNVKDELNCIFMNSEPEPINFKWNNGQMVIVKYHLDNLWYRGIILEVSVLFNLQRIICFSKLSIMLGKMLWIHFKIQTC